MKIEAEVGGTKHEVELVRDGDKVTAEIDGRRYDVEVSEPEHDLLVMMNKGRVCELWVSPPAGNSEAAVVTIDGRRIEVTLIDPRKLRGSASAADHAGGASEIKTAMPGKVVRILVAEGDQVSRGDGVIVVEAMKMQNEMKSPKDGAVGRISVAEGDTVAAGDVLVVIV